MEHVGTGSVQAEGSIIFFLMTVPETLIFQFTGRIYSFFLSFLVIKEDYYFVLKKSSKILKLKTLLQLKSLPFLSLARLTV